MHPPSRVPQPGKTIFATSTSPWDFMPDYIRGERSEHAVGIDDTDRLFHMHIVGKTGTGKSTLLKMLMQQDLSRGHGFALLDPHGDLAEEVLDGVPRSRIQDVVYLNPADTDFPMPFNILEAVDEAQHHLIAAGLVSIFKRFWAESWGPRTEYLIKNAVLALLEAPGTTLLDVPRILIDDVFRNQVISHLRNPVVSRFWKQEYAGYSPSFREEVIAPIQNKVGEFTMTPLVRNIVGQRKNLFELRKLMDEGKVLVVNLAKGALGEDTAALLGSMILTRIMLAAFTRQNIPERDRRPFFLYVDEFPSFATQATMSTLLSEARKYKVGLVLSHQYLAQLSDDLRGAIFGNVGTTISFKLGAEDAEYMAREFSPVAVEEIAGLDQHHIFIRLKVGDTTSHPFTAKTLLPPQGATSQRGQIVRWSRQYYARPRAVVERDAKNTVLLDAPAFLACRAARGPGEAGVSRPRRAVSGVTGRQARSVIPQPPKLQR
jgi:hypothetical protein